jgi:DNA-binding transcriptional LysR family regulator
MFLAVAEFLGFRAAARHLGITPSAVSQAIRSLEERLVRPSSPVRHEASG